MSSSSPADLFASAAPFYARYRAGYDPRFYDHITARLRRTDTVLDLGAGTGEIALRLAPLVATVIAVDPEEGMLREGRRLAKERGVTGIDWRTGAASDLTAMNLPPVQLVTIGKAFHWMDRAQVAANLDEIVTPDGAVAIVSDGHPDNRPRDDWEPVTAEVRSRYLGPQRRAGSGTYEHPAEGHSTILARSPFSHVDILRWDRIIPRTLDEVIGLQFSFSYSTPALLGDRIAEFEADLRQALTKLQPDGKFEEHIRTEALIATRP